MTYEVRNEEVEEALRKVGREIKHLCPQGWGFTVLIFSYGPDGSMFYVSSADRNDVIKSMREFIQKFEAN